MTWKKNLEKKDSLTEKKHAEHISIKFSLLILMFFVQYNFSYGQEKQNINLQINNVSLDKIINKIEETSQYIFIYNPELIKNFPNRSISVKNKSINIILDYLFEGTDITYRMNGRQIILYKKEKPDNNDKRLNENQDVNQQKRIISGLVTSIENEPLPGVNIIVNGTTIGNITNIDGKYQIAVPANADTLIYSFVGMKTSRIPVSGRSVINIKMEYATTTLSEVVAVGYGSQKKESVVGAISVVGEETLMKSSTSNITSAISGKASGVLTIQNSGEPGDNHSEIIIRGLSSWNSSAPLIMVDGVERDFSNMDPTEINSISVLKDASATAVFGARGANGVILVTTKRGEKSKPHLDVSYSEGIIRPTRVADFIDSYTTMKILNVAMMNEMDYENLTSEKALSEYRNPSSPLKSLQYPTVDWFNMLTKDFASSRNANISLRGGGDLVRYYCSLAYTHEGDFFKRYNDGAYVNTNYTYDRLNYRSNIDLLFSKNTKLFFNLGGDLSIKNEPSVSIWSAIYNTSPARFPAYFPDWVLDMVPDKDYPDASGMRFVQSFGEYYGNPYTQAYQRSFSKYFSSRLFVDLIFDQKLDIITKGLSFKGKVSLSTYFRNMMSYLNYSLPGYTLQYDLIGATDNPWTRQSEGNEVYTDPILNITTGGLQDNFYSDFYYETGLYYDRSFSKHSVTGLLLLNRQEKQIGTDFPYYNEGVIGRFTYDYSNKYLLELNIGYTGSERFAPGNRFGFFPSGALGWWISEEPFFKNNVKWINKLKVRYSDGYVGSDYAANRWLYISEYSKDTKGYIHEDSGANSAAQWEMAHKKDIGVEIGLLKNALHFSVDFFDEYRDKMLLTPLTTMFVGTTFKELNLGSMKKHGFEVEAEYKGRTSNKIEYYLKANVGFNENRIIYKADAPYAPDYQKAEGKPVGAQLSGVELTGSGYFTTVDDIHNNPAPISIESILVGDYKFLDYNADGLIDQRDVYPVYGSLYPPITYSFSSGISYKGFEFNFLFHGNKGKFVEFNQTMENEFVMGSWRVHTSQLDYWTPQNPRANHATLNYTFSNNPNLSWAGGTAYSGYNGMIVDRLWRDASFLRLKDVFIGYSFKNKLLKKTLGVSNSQVYATAHNILTFTNLIEADPERKTIEQGSSTSGYYPQSYTVKLGIKLSF